MNIKKQPSTPGFDRLLKINTRIFIRYNYVAQLGGHNIIQIHNNVLWDWQYSMEYSSYFSPNVGIFHEILAVPHNIVMDLNNIMGLCDHLFCYSWLLYLNFDYEKWSHNLCYLWMLTEWNKCNSHPIAWIAYKVGCTHIKTTYFIVSILIFFVSLVGLTLCPSTFSQQYWPN